MTILILTQDNDTHADRVAATLRARGADVVRFDPADFPAKAALSVGYGAGGTELRLTTGGRAVALHELGATWHRRPRPPVADTRIGDEPTRAFVEEASRVFVNDVWDGLTCLQVPGPRPLVMRAQQKAAQLGVAGRLGFELPPTLFTNDPEAFLAFAEEHAGRVVTKPATITDLPRPNGPNRFGRYTEVVSRRDVGYADAVRFCPIVVQAYVPKRLELRVTVVGERVFPAEIHSQESHHTRHDWRRYDDATTRYAPHRLPPELADRCRRLVTALGLHYGALDLILTPDGRYVFLEINPSGQYLWVEEATGLAIGDAVCDLLLSGLPNPARPALMAVAPSVSLADPVVAAGVAQ